MKVKGLELSRFMKEAWPGTADGTDEDWYWDHDLFDDTPDPGATYDTEDLGPVLYQGRGDDPTDGQGYALAGLIRAWRKTRDAEVFQVAVPKDKVAEFKAVLKTLKGSVIT